MYEYKCPVDFYNYNNVYKVKVKKAWIEKHWKYGSNGETLIWSGYQLVIKLTESNINNYSIDWGIGADCDFYIRSCGQACLNVRFFHFYLEIL